MKMYEFMKRRKGENKREYKARVEGYINEILDRKEVSTEYVDLLALIQSRCLIIKIGDVILSEMSKEERDLFKGNAQDLEKFIQARFFDHLDEKEYEDKRREIWDQLKENGDQAYWERSKDLYDMDYFDWSLVQDETFEEEGQFVLAKKNRRVNPRKPQHILED